MQSFNLTEREMPYIVMALNEYGCAEWTVSSDGKLTGEISVRKARLLRQRAYEFYQHYRDYERPLSDAELFEGKLQITESSPDEMNEYGESIVGGGTMSPRQWKKYKRVYDIADEDD